MIKSLLFCDFTANLYLLPYCIGSDEANVRQGFLSIKFFLKKNDLLKTKLNNNFRRSKMYLLKKCYYLGASSFLNASVVAHILNLFDYGGRIS